MPSETEEVIYTISSTTAAASDKGIIPVGSKTRTTRPMPKEPIPKYQTSFFQDIEGMDPLEKFMPQRFTLYDGKSAPRSHVNHVRQSMALWNHLDALMCRVFPSSLGDLGLK